MPSITVYNLDQLLIPSELAAHLRRSGFELEKPIGMARNALSKRVAEFHQPPADGHELLTAVFDRAKSSASIDERIDALEKRLAALEIRHKPTEKPNDESVPDPAPG